MGEVPGADVAQPADHRLRVQGMGGGTFHSRYEPSIGPYGPGTPQYDGAFASYVGQLQSHLRQKGWLDMMYVYWFDEPAPPGRMCSVSIRGRPGANRFKRFMPSATNS